MFKETLYEDLRAIFEFENIRNQSVSEGIEQDVLYLTIDSIKQQPKEGFYYFSVSGTIGTHSSELVNRYGFLLERARLSDWPNKGRFRFSSRERSIPVQVYENMFIKTELNFEYRVEIPFNPTVGEITFPKLKWVWVIINKLKERIKNA